MNHSIFENQLDAILSEPLSEVLHREQSSFDEQATPFEKSLVLFGAGSLGQKALAGLRRLGIEPLAFTDNDPSKWGKEISGIKIYSLQRAVEEYGQKAAFVITIWKGESPDRMAERRQQLLDLNCKKVIQFGYLFWKYPEIFLPHYALDLPHNVIIHADEVRKVFSLWDDVDSQNEYLAQIKWRILLDFDSLPAPVSHEIYFPDDLVKNIPEDVFVDCGAFDGDTIRNILHSKWNSLAKIIAFEPDPVNFLKLQQFAFSLPASIRGKILLQKLAIGLQKGKVQFKATGTESSSIGNGDHEVDCISLDEILSNERPTFIKMDIEGSEFEALMGAQNIIQKELPILAICVYHHQDHVWRIPSLICSLSDQYRFFLRPHLLEVWDLVCYAIPKFRLTSKNSTINN
jgi:FkbM family methyltransferase